MRMRAVLVAIVVGCGATACSSESQGQPVCSEPQSAILVLEAQSVPEATRLPCIAELPIGWRFGGSLVRDDGATIWLDHDRAGAHAVEVVLMSSCDVAEAVEVPPAPDEIGMRTYQEPVSLDPYVGTRSLVFNGGCIEHRYRFVPGSEPGLVIEADLAVSTLPRTTIVSEVRSDLDLTVCGFGAPPCAG